MACASSGPTRNETTSAAFPTKLWKRSSLTCDTFWCATLRYRPNLRASASPSTLAKSTRSGLGSGWWSVMR
jgi:hypothetical protein